MSVRHNEVGDCILKIAERLSTYIFRPNGPAPREITGIFRRSGWDQELLRRGVDAIRTNQEISIYYIVIRERTVTSEPDGRKPMTERPK
jgi:hypothetical protein